MVSAIDPTKPADGVPAAKADLRASLLAAKLEIESLQATKLQNGAPINMEGKELTRPVLKDYREKIVNLRVITGTLTLNLGAGNVFKVTMNEDLTSLIIANPPETGIAAYYILILKQDGKGGRILSWPSSIRWSGGQKPSISA